MDIRDLKDKFESGGYVLYWKDVEPITLKYKWVKNGSNSLFNGIEYQAIHKKDEIIADNVIANPDVKVEFKGTANEWFVDEKDFFRYYDKSLTYRLNLNGGYCEATKENYDALVECGYELLGFYKRKYINYKTIEDRCRYNDYLCIENNKILFLNGNTNREQFHFQDNKPTWIKPEPTNVAEDIYNEVQKHQNYKIVKDFTDTYCVASELHYEKLNFPSPTTIKSIKGEFLVFTIYGFKSTANLLDVVDIKNYRQIKYNEQINEFVFINNSEDQKDGKRDTNMDDDVRPVYNDTSDNTDRWSDNMDRTESREVEARVEHFAKFGFQVPDFECKIYEEIDGELIGYIKEHKLIYACKWLSSGSMLNKPSDYFNKFDLTPLKRNFPMLMVLSTQGNGILFDIAYHQHAYDVFINDGWRQANEAEFFSLHYDKV